MSTPTKIGRYEILERVGRGGMGVLYRGRDTVLDREVAIKVMSTDFAADDDSASQRFYREARAAAKLQHRNIVTIFEFGEEDHTPFIAMEFLHGQDLAKRMRRDPPLRLEAKLDIVADLCAGLHFAHEQGVVHRDVKPANIWILPDGSVKLLDFGIAKFAASTMTREGSMLGSVSYMAPEQVIGRDVDGRADVFAAGVVLFELLAGRKPFAGESPTAVLARIMDDRPAPIDQLGPDVPRPLAQAVARALQKDRDARYRHAADFGADLRLIRSALASRQPLAFDLELTRGTPPPADRTVAFTHGSAEPAGAAELRAPGDTGPMPPVAEPRPRLRAWLLSALALAVALVAAAVVFWPRSGARDPAVVAVAGPTAVSSSSPGSDHPAVKTAPPGVPAEPPPSRSAASTARPASAVSPPRPEPATSQVAAPVLGVEVVLAGSYPFEVYSAEGELLAAAAGEHHLRVTGRRTVIVSAPEYFLDASYVVGAANRLVRVPELGRIKLRFPEGCSVVFGKRTLSEPPNAELPIAAGTYRIRMSCSDESVRSYPVTIRAGDMSQAFITK